MPEISRFFGIVVRMYYLDHNPPHFHASYGSAEALIRIDGLDVLAGDLPPRVLGLVREWATLHAEALTANWWRLRAASPPESIQPLEQLMLPRIVGVRVLERQRIALEFTDGTSGLLDLAPMLSGRGGVFTALADPDVFATVRVDAEAGTLVWPNGADIDPDMLYHATHASAGATQVRERAE